jgi:calpain-15
MSTEQMFQYMKHADRHGWLIAAGTRGKDGMTENGGPGEKESGIVDGHAYSVIEVRQVGKFQLLCVRNPWGTFEYGGAWADGSVEWEKNPRVKKTLKPSFDASDGLFWMAWEDFDDVFGECHCNTRRHTL